MADLDDIESRLDSIESNLSTIERKVDGLPYYIFWIALCAFIGWILAASDFSCSIPAHKPIKEKTYKTTDGAVGYNIIYDESFQGSVNYYPTSTNAYFNIQNIGKSSIDLKDAKFYLFSKDKYRFELIVDKLEKYYRTDNSTILNPYSLMFINTFVSGKAPPVDNIEGFKIETKSGKEIRFGYKNLSWVGELRWLIAGNIRKN